jgi:UDP-3-O-[3-hydroxymyristoyl] glucosamine N-acyltransferase
LLVSQVGIGGSSSTGDYVVLAGQVGVVGHVHIGEGTVVGGQSGVVSNIPAGQRVLGTPTLPEHEQKRVWVSFGKIPEMYRDVQRLKKQLGLIQ